MALKNRSSALAVVRETTAGTPVVPSVGTEFIALQSGFQFSPNFETLSNDELKSSIGAAKSIQGLESPQGSINHYMRHSGTEGTAPGFGLLLEGVLGSTSSNGTQRTTTTGSTVSVVKLAAGGSDFARGKAILLKDGTNGYSIRPVLSVSSNDLTLGFDLANAPASGIGAGKCVNYAPANTGHPTFSAWLYRGNPGAIELIAGSIVTEAGINFAAGQLINTSYSFEGTAYYFDPITITSSTNKLDFTDDDGTFAATITAKTYRDPHELAAAVEAAMETANSGETKTVTYSDTTGKFTIKSSGTVLSLLWNSGANTANTIAAKLGFSAAADSTGTAATTGYTSANAITLSNAITPSYDSADPVVAKANEVLLGDTDDIVNFCASTVDVTISNNIVNAECVGAESGVDEKIIEGRVVTIAISALLEQYDADKFKKFRANDTIAFAYNFGTKTGGNWVAGTCGNLYSPSAVISDFSLGDSNGLVSLDLELTCFVDSSGNGEFYINFL